MVLFFFILPSMRCSKIQLVLLLTVLMALYTLGIVKHVYKNEGILGFWAGVRPNVTRTFLVNAAGDEPVMNQQPNTPPSPKPVPVQKSARMTQPKPISERQGCCPMACRLISQRVASRGFVRRWWQPQ